MAKKRKAKAKPKAKARQMVDEKQLTKGQLRKLNALRKSLGDEIAEKAFVAWFDRYASSESGPADKNAQTIVETLAPLLAQNKLRIPRGGYLLTRGRGRVIVTRAASG